MLPSAEQARRDLRDHRWRAPSAGPDRTVSEWRIYKTPCRVEITATCRGRRCAASPAQKHSALLRGASPRSTADAGAQARMRGASWDPQLRGLTDHCHVIIYDARGHRSSEAPVEITAYSQQHMVRGSIRTHGPPAPRHGGSWRPIDGQKRRSQFRIYAP
jgi:hypothetical protein